MNHLQQHKQAVSLPALFGECFQVVLQGTDSQTDICNVASWTFSSDTDFTLVLRDHSELTEHIRRQGHVGFWLPLPEGGYIEGRLTVGVAHRMGDNVVIAGAVIHWQSVPAGEYKLHLRT